MDCSHPNAFLQLPLIAQDKIIVFANAYAYNMFLWYVKLIKSTIWMKKRNAVLILL